MWVQILYAEPRARLRVNDTVTDKFHIARSTRQGCPMSPLLFSLAKEPLVALLRVDKDIRGCSINAVEKNTSLYADDMLLYLAEAEGSLTTALDRISGFGRYSGFKVNWNKSIIFSFQSDYAASLAPDVSLKVVSRFRYLGVEV